MTFPVVFNVFGFGVPAHVVFDALAYGLGGWLFRRGLRRERLRPDVERLSIEQNLWLLAGVVFGAAVGAKLLAWAEDPDVYLSHLAEPQAWVGGKTIAGGLLGGWVGIELAKLAVGVRRRTGDWFVLPLTVGIAVGRVGCFLTGLPDHTYGIATGLPWGVDFGDGVHRHPTQLYESLFVLALGAAVLWRRPGRLQPGRGASRDTGPAVPTGAGFRVFLLGYCLFRVAVEFIKPSDKPLAGLSAIQWACVAGASACAVGLIRLARDPRTKELKAAPTPAMLAGSNEPTGADAH
jgi:prolipoprotein diacylglyceryltransferase